MTATLNLFEVYLNQGEYINTQNCKESGLYIDRSNNIIYWYDKPTDILWQIHESMIQYLKVSEPINANQFQELKEVQQSNIFSEEFILKLVAVARGNEKIKEIL